MTSKYRCETCKKFWRHNLDMGCRNSGSIWNISKEVFMWVSDVGCASHSDFQNQLDKLIKWLDEREAKRLSDSKGRNEDHEFINELYAHRDIDITFRNKIEELRDEQ